MFVARHRISKTAVALMTFAWLVGAGGATAQGHCTLNQLAGTYAFESHGSITFALTPYPPIDWSLISRPFAFVGSFTILSDGSMSGEGWVLLGRISSGLTARPFAGQLLDLDEATCTAVLEWLGSPAPGAPAGWHQERLVFVDNGREFRSMLEQSPSGAMAWIGRGHRMTPAETIGTCGPHLLAGDVLIQCEAIGVEGLPASSASLARLTVYGDGSFTGTAYVKDPVYAEVPVQGAFDVQPDCRIGATLESTERPGVVHHGRGLIFHAGKEGFLILPVETALADGSIVRPAFARCELRSLGR